MNSKKILLYLFYSFIIAGLYYVSVIFTKPFILPPTFAAPIWPTAGIGIGVLILWGYRYIPAIVLGEVLTYIQFYNRDAFDDYTSLIMTYGALLFATILRSTLGTYLVNHHLGKTNNYLTIQSVTKLLVFAGLIPTFISSFIATLTLYNNNLFSYDSWIINFFTWWFGDVVGICIVLPLMFLIFKKPRNIWSHRLLKTALPVVITTFLLVVVSNKIKQLELDRIIESLDHKIEILNNSVIDKFKRKNLINVKLTDTQSVDEVNNIYSNDLTEVLSKNKLQDVHFIVYSVSDIKEKLVYESSYDFSKYLLWKKSKEYYFAKHTWKIVAYPTSVFYVNNASWLIWWLTSIGFVFIALMGAGLLVITGSQIIIKNTVIKRTDEIKTLNEILQQSEKRYKQLIEIQPVIFWKHVRGEKLLEFVSNEAINILGYKKKEILNLDLVWNKIIHPNDRSKTLRDYYKGIESKKRFSLKYRAVAKNGEYIWFKDFITTRLINGKVEVIGLKIDITKDQLKEQEISQLAYYDSLTELPNRVSFRKRLNKAIIKAKSSDKNGAILFLDLDRFKVLNDSMGHYFGDKLLIQISQRLQKALSKNDVSSRFGGDEFVILINKQHQSLKDIQKHALNIAKKIQAMIKEPFNIDGHNFFTTFSTGISLFPHNSEKADEIIQQADIAMYSSKEKGKNTISFFQNEMQVLANKKLTIEKSLKIALIRREFQMYYQPIFDQDRNILKFESLIRWNHPEEGLLTPESFIHIAEETGFINELSEWIIDSVIEQVAVWKSSDDKSVEISINISLFQFINTQIIDVLTAAIEKYNIDSQLITLELTETIGIGDFEAALIKLNKLSEMGFKIAIDDFGTGYSSLNYLNQMPIDILKLDKSFVADIGKEKNSDSLIETIILMAKQLDLELIVEGVETEDQFEFLKKRGCNKFQGYLVNPALPVNKLSKYI